MIDIDIFNPFKRNKNEIFCVKKIVFKFLTKILYTINCKIIEISLIILINESLYTMMIYNDELL